MIVFPCVFRLRSITVQISGIREEMVSISLYILCNTPFPSIDIVGITFVFNVVAMQQGMTHTRFLESKFFVDLPALEYLHNIMPHLL